MKAGDEGKCSKSQKRKILETAGMKANRNLKKVLPKVEPLKKKYFSETKVLPLAVLCSMVIYTVFALVYYHVDG